MGTLQTLGGVGSVNVGGTLTARATTCQGGVSVTLKG